MRTLELTDQEYSELNWFITRGYLPDNFDTFLDCTDSTIDETFNKWDNTTRRKYHVPEICIHELRRFKMDAKESYLSCMSPNLYNRIDKLTQ